MRYYPLATAFFVLISLLVEAVCFFPLPLTYQYVSSIHKLTQISSILTHPSIIMCTVYVPPSPNESSQLSLINYLHNLFSSSHTVIVLSDFNCPDINWDLYTSTSEFSSQLCDLVFDLELSQMIDAPTHTKGNVLDLSLPILVIICPTLT